MALTESLFLQHVLQFPCERPGTAGCGTVVRTLLGQLSCWQALGDWAWCEGREDGDMATLAAGGGCLGCGLAERGVHNNSATVPVYCII